MRANQTRTYDRASSVVFLKTGEPFGGLSNMAGGFPLWVNGIRILTSEALYQACRFPHRPEVQTLIIEQRSPMTAKMKSKPYRHDSRPDWDQVRVKIMRWCLRVKLAQNWRAFSELLLETGDRPIVEESRKDAFWGAKATDDGTLVGMNVLGRLLMELREAVRVEGRELLMSVQPLAIPKFLLGGRPIEIVASQVPEQNVSAGTAAVAHARGEAQRTTVQQGSLFDAPAAKEAPPAAYAAVRAQDVHVADLKPYAEYKDSGLPWLGEVPAHWNLRRLKFLLREVDSRSTDGREQLLRVSQYTGVTERKSTDGSEAPDTRAASLVGYKKVAKNDLVINIMLAWNGSLGVSRYNGIVSPAYCVYRFGVAAVPAYYHELLRLPSYKGRIKVASTGVVESRLRLYSDQLGAIEALLPPPDEQAAIVRFLDWANARLERAIRAKRKVIALLGEQKQAIIHRAVTRGLDPTVPLKPSGIPWLGDIPQHWEVWPLRRCISIRSGDFADPLHLRAERSEPHCIPVVGGNGVMGFTDRVNNRDTTIVIGRVGALCGNVHLVDGEAWITDNALRITRITGFAASYLAEQLRVMDLNRLANANAQPLITGGTIKSQRVVKPPQGEQEQIAERLPVLTAPTITTISRLEREIELLREYRTRLVADVVTGKLDVREAALLLPDEAPLDSVQNAADLGDEIESEAEEVEA